MMPAIDDSSMVGSDDRIITLPSHDRAIDITAETCPMTFVKTRLALDAMAEGQVLLVRLKGEEPLANVPRAAADQGHEPLDLIYLDDGSAIVVIRKGFL